MNGHLNHFSKAVIKRRKKHLHDLHAGVQKPRPHQESCADSIYMQLVAFSKTRLTLRSLEENEDVCRLRVDHVLEQKKGTLRQLVNIRVPFPDKAGSILGGFSGRSYEGHTLGLPSGAMSANRDGNLSSSTAHAGAGSFFKRRFLNRGMEMCINASLQRGMSNGIGVAGAAEGPHEHQFIVLLVQLTQLPVDNTLMKPSTAVCLRWEPNLHVLHEAQP